MRDSDIIDYKVVTGHHPADLTKNVKTYLAQGWVLRGDTGTCPYSNDKDMPYFYQVMVRYSET